MNARIPARYRIPANKQAAFEAAVQEESRRLFREYDRYSTDIVIIAVVLVMIRVFGWGSGARATRVPRLIEEVRRTIDYYCERYDHDSALVAMRRDLREFGVIYEGVNEDDR